MNFSKLKFDIDKSKISIRELSRRVGMSYAGLHRSIKEGTINTKHFENICKVLELNPNDYFELDKEIPPIEELSIVERLRMAENILSDIRKDLENDGSKEQ